MSDQDPTVDTNADPTTDTQTVAGKKTELDLLKERADQMGIIYHPSIGIEKLKEKINAVLDASENKSEDASKMTEYQKHNQLRLESTKLIRVIVNCHNPAKQAWPGEIFTVSNKAIGNIRKFVPFNNENGWHIPYAIYQMLLERKCSVYYTYTDPRTHFKTRKQRLIQEFTVTVLPALNQDELDELAAQQSMNGTIDK